MSVSDVRKIRAARIRERMAEKGMDQEDLAQAVGVTQGTISLILTGKTKDSRHFPAIAHALGSSLPWIMGHEVNSADAPEDGGVTGKTVDGEKRLGDRRITYRDETAENGERDSDIVTLNEFDLAYGLGAAFIHDVPVTGRLRKFSRAFIRHFTDSPFEYLFFAKGNGTSMMPTILDNDIVLIDTFDKTPRLADNYWALEMGGMGMIKRLRPTNDGNGIRICSDSGLPDDIAYDNEMQVIGRIVGIFRKT